MHRSLLLLLLLTGASARAQESIASFHEIPLSVVYIGTVAFVIGSIWVGFWIGKTWQASVTSTASPTINSVTGALMGLLAFLLAFTFAQSMQRYDVRRNLYIDQVNGIELAYRRAELLPERYRTVLKTELMKYVDLRIGVIGHAEKIPDMVRQSNAIHVTLHNVLEQMGRDGQIDGNTLFQTSNLLLSLTAIHNRRTTVATIYHLPTPLWFALYALVMISMVGMGHIFALAPKINWPLAIVLSFSFSAVVLLIADLDRSGAHKSLTHFDQKAMINLKERLNGLDL